MQPKRIHKTILKHYEILPLDSLKDRCGNILTNLDELHKKSTLNKPFLINLPSLLLTTN